MRVEGLAPAEAHGAIGEAFRIVEDIHRLMSFHEPDSELSRLNRDAWRTPVRVGDHTRAVLSKALDVARASDGIFDPTVAPALVESGFLPAPAIGKPSPAASWRDIVLDAGDTVSFARPLWIDLGGIAKGYAVDCAVAHLATFGATRICVEAGGDLRLAGPEPEPVHLAGPSADREIPVLEVQDAAVASSGSLPQADGRTAGPHIDPRTGRPCRTDRFVTVVAPRCIEADALTKVTMAAGTAAAPVLARFQAQAFLCDGTAWYRIAEAA